MRRRAHDPLSTLITLIALFGLPAAGHGSDLFAPAGAADFRVLLVGDSWPDQMTSDGVLDTVFALEGHPELLAKGDVTAISGSTAAEWTAPGMLQVITDELDAHPTIEVVQLTLGGNDFLAGMSGDGWYQGISDAAKDALFAQIAADVAAVVDHVLAHDPDVLVVLSYYDYPNFVETLSGLLGFFCTAVWNDLGQPTPAELNGAGAELYDLVAAIADGRPRVVAARHEGLMQFTFGYPSMAIAPGTLEPPGDPSLPSPPEAMRFGGADCFHLSAAGYQAIAQSLWDGTYRFVLVPPVFSDGFETGDLLTWSSSVP